MKKNLLDYVKRYSLIPGDICNNIVSDISKLDWKQHTFYDPVGKNSVNISGSNELWITGQQPKDSDILMEYINAAVNIYVQDVDTPAWNGPSQICTTRFNRYESGQTMALHSDHIHTIFDGERKGIPVITILTSLNDKYTGGEFIMFEDTLVKMNKGDILVFPSIFLYPHKVLPVKSGTRYTCVNWAW